MTEPAPSRHGTVRVVADGAATGGAYAILDIRATAGTAFPAHVQRREDGVLLVVAGALDVVLRGERRALEAGQHLALPRGVPRSYAVRRDVHALYVALPAGLERLAGLADDPPADRDDLAALLAAADVRLLPDRGGGRTERH